MPCCPPRWQRPLPHFAYTPLPFTCLAPNLYLIPRLVRTEPPCLPRFTCLPLTYPLPCPLALFGSATLPRSPAVETFVRLIVLVRTYVTDALAGVPYGTRLRLRSLRCPYCALPAPLRCRWWDWWLLLLVSCLALPLRLPAGRWFNPTPCLAAASGCPCLPPCPLAPLNLLACLTLLTPAPCPALPRPLLPDGCWWFTTPALPCLARLPAACQQRLAFAALAAAVCQRQPSLDGCVGLDCCAKLPSPPLTSPYLRANLPPFTRPYATLSSAL